MCQQFAAARSAGVVLAVSKKNILAGCERARTQSTGKRISLSVGMYTDCAKIDLQRGFHLGAHATIEGPAIGA